MTTSSLDHWRDFFRAAGDSDIFHVIRQAIRVAASDHQDEFRRRRDEIAQMLFAEPHHRDEGHGNAVKAIEEKEDDGRGNAFKAIEERREEEPGRGNAVVKSHGALFPPRTPSAEQNPAGAAIAVYEEKVDTTRREVWKVSVSENGKIRLRRALHEQTKKPQRTSTEPLDHEGSLPTFTERQPVLVPLIAPSTEHPQGRFQRASTKPVIAVARPEPPRLLNMREEDDALLGSKLETTKRKLREGYQQTENAKRQRRIQVIQPREIPKDCSNKKPLLFKGLGTWLR